MITPEIREEILRLARAGAPLGDVNKVVPNPPEAWDFLQENDFTWDEDGNIIADNPPAPASAPKPAVTAPESAAESFENLLWDKICEQMGDDAEAIPPDAVMCILEGLEVDDIDFPKGMNQIAVRALIKKLDAERRGVEYKPKTNGKPVGKSAIQLADFKPKCPADEVWYPCKAPASSYTVSSYARVATLVGGRGTQIGKILKPRVSAPKGGRALLCVQIRTDAGQKRDYPVQWLFDNARPKTPAEIARRRAYEKAKRERESE